MGGERLLLVGCGILQREVSWLISKNDWPMDTLFLDSALHIDFEALSRVLRTALSSNQGRNIMVFYGACHPLMEQVLEDANTFRTEGQNCLEMLLGHVLFTEQLCDGAFFVLEEWARGWNHIMTKTFGRNRQVIREIFQGDRQYLLCLKTPCSGHFLEEAEEAGKQVGLPIRWMEVSLDHLESVLLAAIAGKMRERQCQR
jgi:hypothetical protein